MKLNRINLEGFIFSVPGGERVNRHAPDDFPADAYGAQWHPEGREGSESLPEIPPLTLTYLTPAETEDGEPVGHSRTFTEAEIEAAKDIPVEPVPVPQSLTRREFHLAAASVGITRQTILDQIALIPDETQRNLALIDYEESRDFRRDWPLLASMAGNLGVTETQLDDLFRLGASYRNTPAV